MVAEKRHSDLERSTSPSSHAEPANNDTIPLAPVEPAIDASSTPVKRAWTSSPKSTLATLGVFLAACAALSFAPLPSWAKPLELRSRDDVNKVVARVFAKPKMTLQHVEEKLAAGSADGRDAPAGQSIDDEEKELLKTRDAKADVDALASVDAKVNNDAPAAQAVHVDRAAIVARVKSPKADTFRSEAKDVKAPFIGGGGALVENPCLIEEPSPAGGVRCTRTALDSFYATLDAIAAGDESARAEALVLGNSLIASDHVVDVVRARLVERFGDAGRGFLLPERLSKVAGRKVRTGEGTSGWNIETFAQDAPTDGSKLGPFGFTGSLHESTGPGERTTWITENAVRAKLFYLEHTGQPAMRLEAKGQSGWSTIARVEAIAMPKSVIVNTALAARERDETLDVDLPAGTSEITLVAEGKGAKVYGVALEADKAGVVVDTIGVPAASARLYVEGSDAEIFARQVALREPSLFVAMLGGNEVRAFNYGTLDAKKFDTYLSELVHRLKAAAPSASCMLVAPIDAVKATAAGEELQTRPEIYDVMKVQRAVAKREGCAYFDMFTAMGGAGALARFKDKGMLSDDLVHPTWKGGDVLGQIFADALLDSYARTPAPDDGVAVARRKNARVRTPVYAGLSFPAEERPVVVVKGASDAQKKPVRRALSRFFEKLRALERGDTASLTAGHVTIGQLGASHTAGQMWTDAMRRRLGEKFGVAGRGFVSVGRESKRLEGSGVARTLEGAFEIADGREVVLGGAVGMSGTKVRLEPNAKFSVSFCNNVAPRGAPKGAPKEEAYGCAKSPGFLQLAWLYTPDMGTADVSIDGRNVAVLSPSQRTPDSDVQFLRLPIDGELASLEVNVRGAKKDGDAAGPVHLLSVVEERDRPGVVLDSVGLPGTTGMTPQRWRQDLLAAEVRARHYDLVVTAWGTNEAGIGSLDEATYRHHFEKTLDTLMDASPGADCLIIGASDRLVERKDGTWKAAPAHEMVERVQKQIAADRGCAFYSVRTAMGGPGSMRKWIRDGLGNPDHVHFTHDGYDKLANLVIDDLLAAYAYDGALLAEEADEVAAAEHAKKKTDRRGG